MSASYSIDILKRSAFNDEVQNRLDLIPDTEMDEELCIVRDYMMRRIAEIDKAHK